MKTPAIVLDRYEVVYLNIHFGTHERLDAFHRWMAHNKVYSFYTLSSGGPTAAYIALWEPEIAKHVEAFVKEMA